MALITDISCVLPRPDIGELYLQTTAEMSRRLLGGAPVIPGSSESVLSAVMAGSINLAHGFVTQALKENDPSTMCCDNLVRYGSLHGYNLLGATRAKGYVAITGTPGAVIPDDFRVTGGSGREYKLDPAVTFNPSSLDSGGGAVLRMVATLAGAIYNLPTGSRLVVATTTPDIDLEATAVGNGFIGGTADETCEQLRTRILASEKAFAITTNAAWFCQNSLTYPGVTRCCLDECRQCCPDELLIYVFMHGVYGDQITAPYGVPPVEVLDAMTEWMFGRMPGMGQGLAPFGVRGAYVCARPSALTITAWCTEGCPTGGRDRIISAVQAYLAALTCVGPALCKEDVRAVASTAVGQSNCFSDVRLSFDVGVAFEDASHIYLDCGQFAVLKDVVLNQGPPPPIEPPPPYLPPPAPAALGGCCPVVPDQKSITGTGTTSDVLEVGVVDGGEDV